MRFVSVGDMVVSETTDDVEWTCPECGNVSVEGDFNTGDYLECPSCGGVFESTF